MLKFDMTVLLVKAAKESEKFYADILGADPIDGGPEFTMFAVEGGRIALWSQNSVVPDAAAKPGSTEITFMADDKTALENLCADWKSKGVEIIQDITEMPFGTTFTATDPDGHRIRAFVPALRQ